MCSNIVVTNMTEVRKLILAFPQTEDNKNNKLLSVFHPNTQWYRPLLCLFPLSLGRQTCNFSTGPSLLTVPLHAPPAVSLFLPGKYKKYIPAVGQQKEGTRLSEKITMDGGLLEAAIGLGGQLSRWLKPTDFLPGTVVTFEMPSSGSKLFTLEILGHDEYTRKLLEDKARHGDIDVVYRGCTRNGVFEIGTWR